VLDLAWVADNINFLYEIRGKKGDYRDGIS
jgi:hypothetical protein